MKDYESNLVYMDGCLYCCPESTWSDGLVWDWKRLSGSIALACWIWVVVWRYNLASSEEICRC